MISALLLLIFVHAEEVKSIPTVELYDSSNPAHCARECKKISVALNPQNDIPEVGEFFLQKCEEKQARSAKENPVVYSELLRCAGMAKDKLVSIKDYIFSGALKEDVKKNVPAAAKATGDAISYTVHNADTILSGAYTGTKEAIQNTTNSTLAAINNFKNSLSKNEYEQVLAKCDASEACRIAVARGFLQFTERKPNGDYRFSDQEVLNTIKNMPFNAILNKSIRENNIAKTHCEALQSEIMQAQFIKNNRQWPKDLQEQLNKELRAKNPACPFILTQKDTAAGAALYGKTPTDSPGVFHMWDMVDSCFGRDALQQVNDIACKIAGNEAATIAVGGALSKILQVGVRAVRARKLALALQERKAIPDGHELISALDDKVITRATENGKPVYYSIAPGKAPQKIAMDPSGFAINARDGVNRQLALQDITAAQLSGDGKAVLMIDVNNLGKVNYFKNGLQAGDEYLGEVARIISEKTAGKGKVYRWGGDEFVVVLNETDKGKLRALNQEISDAVMKSPKLRSIFSAEKKAAADRYKLLFPPHGQPSTITSYDQLPATFKDALLPAEAEFARRDFPAFLARVKEVDTKAIYDSATIQPSISMGAATTAGRTADEVLVAADKQAAQVKKTYKSALGCDDTKKYTGREAYLVMGSTCTLRDLSARPVALEPH